MSVDSATTTAMAGHARVVTFQGAAGVIDCALDWPEAEQGIVQGWALLLHPHPLFGGTRDNKVVTTLSRAFVQAGWGTLRPNFRGVGLSAGTFDEGQGETADMQALIEQAADWLAKQFPGFDSSQLALGGFSFGAAVLGRLAEQLRLTGITPCAQVLIGCAVSRFPVPALEGEVLLVHGELDETVPLADVLNWARPQDQPVLVVPGADHFFHRKLMVLKNCVGQYLLNAPYNSAAS